MLTYKALAALLTYPEAELIAALPEIEREIVREGKLPRREREALQRLFEHLQSRDPLALQEDYVACFDRGRATSLYLFEHVHGESRDRGQAMVDLKAQYAAHGLALAPGELPDYLSAFLEYLSLRPAAEARGQLTEIVHILQNLHAALARRGSHYAAVIAALIALAGEKAQAVEPVPCGSDREAGDLEALDRAWEDQPAFGPGSAGACGAAAATPQPLRFMSSPSIGKGVAS
jgi:nitrate reductase delta subunit